MSNREVKLYFADIKQAIGKIENYTRELNQTGFESDEKTIDAVIRNLEVIGEAASHIPKEIKGRYPDIPWEKIIAMRNKVIHEYFGIDWDILWQTVEQDIPWLKKVIRKIKL